MTRVSGSQLTEREGDMKEKIKFYCDDRDTLIGIIEDLLTGKETIEGLRKEVDRYWEGKE